MSPLAQLLHRSTLLLDFDGPICGVFAGTSSAAVAARLRELTGTAGSATTDPFDVLRTAENGQAGRVHELLADLEIAAVATAHPTPGSGGLIRSWKDSGRSVAVVSNNSTVAVRAYLAMHGLAAFVQYVAGRSDPDPRLLKPSPYLVIEAMAALGTSADHCVLVGDSATDVEAAHRAGVAAIGFANKPGKAERLSGAAAVVTDLGDLAPLPG